MHEVARRSRRPRRAGTPSPPSSPAGDAGAGGPAGGRAASPAGRRRGAARCRPGSACASSPPLRWRSAAARPATTTTSRSVTALAPTTAVADARRAVRAADVRPSTLSTTILSGHGASALEPDLDERQDRDHDHARPIRPQQRQRPGELRHLSLQPGGCRGVGHPRRFAAPSGSGVTRGVDAATAVTPSGLASFTYSQPAGWYAIARGRERPARIRSSVEMRPSGSITRTRLLTEVGDVHDQSLRWSTRVPAPSAPPGSRGRRAVVAAEPLRPSPAIVDDYAGARADRRMRWCPVSAT